ncbi:GlxA family transcriptional regulator [Aliiglaciecola litoralis]|uniref:GlxA family transcriptional regulator n=1 Tax=Aliiglaciecola litoralis TaxID=582857 RepID=A0ABP3X1Y9_9ALTE
MKKTICFLVYDDMELLDLAGAQSAFHEANQLRKGSYEILVVGFDSRPIICESGIQLTPDMSLKEVDNCHTLVIPGGKGARSSEITGSQITYLRSLMSKCKRLVSICTGAFLTARAGLPENTTVTTHWAFINEMATQYPALNVDNEKIYVQDGRYWSSAGVTSGIDLTLRLIELDLGKSVSHQVAKYLVIYSRRSGNQKQYSDALNMQAPKTKRMDAINDWIKNHVSEDITVRDLANLVHLSERQCHRMFLQETKISPAQYIERYRMQLATEYLVTSEKDIKIIACSLGYKTNNGFNRAFERNFSVSPTAYRNAFVSQ